MPSSEFSLCTTQRFPINTMHWIARRRTTAKAAAPSRGRCRPGSGARSTARAPACGRWGRGNYATWLTVRVGD